MNKLFSCFGIFIFMVLLGLMAMALAGVYIPYLSQILYKEPPKLDGIVLVSSDRGKNQLSKIVTSQSLVLDDSDFSSVLSAGFVSRTPYVKLVKANIYSDKVKLLITLNKGHDYYLLADLAPANDGGKFNIKKAQIGNLPIPLFLAKWMLGPNDQFDLSNLFKGYGLKVDDMSLSDKQIQIFFEKK
jgi:hypothetical protein